jgi:outer membrane biosynthesis protein TonB
MKKNQRDKRPSHHPGSPEPLSKRRFTRPVILSLILHALLLIFLAINFKSFLPRSTTNYPVTLIPLGSSGEGTGGGGVPAPPTVEQTALPIETPKPEPKKPESKKPEPEKKQQSSKDQKPDKVLVKKDTVEGLKKTDKAKKAEPVRESSSYKDTQTKIAKMSKEVQGQTGQGTADLASGTPGTGGGGTAVNAYLTLVKAKVTQEWVLPENLSKTNYDLEVTVGFFIDRVGKAQKLRFIKKSGNDLYDQAAMRAIKKAEPFSPILRGLIDEEIGLNFNQQSGIGSGGRP